MPRLLARPNPTAEEIQTHEKIERIQTKVRVLQAGISRLLDPERCYASDIIALNDSWNEMVNLSAEAALLERSLPTFGELRRRRRKEPKQK